MKYSIIPSMITKSFWDGTVAITERRKEEVSIYLEDNCKIIKFPVGGNESRIAILSFHASDGRETEISTHNENDGTITLSIDDPEGRKEAIRRAIKDLMARTLTRKEENKDKDFNAAIEEALLPRINEWLVDSRKDYSDAAFDEWHNNACKDVLAVLREYYINNDEKKTVVQYGKAQKIVNMTMKGLYCLKDADPKSSYFEHCHIPLDSFILEWFFRNVLLPRKEANSAFKARTDDWKKPEKFEEYLRKKESGDLSIKEEMWDKYLNVASTNWEDLLKKLIQLKQKYEEECHTAGKKNAKTNWNENLSNIQPDWIIKDVLHKGHVVSWSVIPEAPEEKAYGYRQYVAWIRNYFNSDHLFKTDTGKKLSPFQAEFYIWPEIQLRMATEAFLFEVDPETYKESDDADYEKQKLRNLSVDDLIQRVKDAIKDYQPQ